MSISYTNALTVEDFNSIRAAVGFRRILPEQVEAEIAGHTLALKAEDDGRAVGMALMLWNQGGGATLSMLVTPDYRERGVEAELIGRALDFLRERLKPGYGIQVDVRAFGYQVAEYERLGFRVSTVEQRGVPMQLCLTEQIELTDRMFKQMEFREN